IEAGDRSCTLSFCRDSSMLDASFKWQDMEMFQIRSDDLGLLASLIKRWVCDRAMPSAMRAEFLSIEIGKVADYFEAGRQVEGEYVASWDDIEETYREFEFKESAAILRFIADLRRAGFDHTFRAGTSMATLILSRARRHGLRPEQPFVAFRFLDRGIVVE